MKDYILLMHNDSPEQISAGWDSYFATLRENGNFQGGSAIGNGVCLSRSGESSDITVYLSGYIRITADSLEHAMELVKGNPVFEAGGTVEIRELPTT